MRAFSTSSVAQFVGVVIAIALTAPSRVEAAEDPELTKRTTAAARVQPRDLAVDGSISDPTPDELAAFLQRTPARSASEAVKAIETLPGFRVDLVASEPHVFSPVAGAFDEDGNLYVAEMIDYPYNRDQPVKISRQNLERPDDRILGRVRLLRDRDGDGRYEESHVFAEELLWAAGIAPWKGGVFVTAPPDLWYLKDTDGDGKADLRKKVFTGFGFRNQQAMVNTLIFGLDHMIYGSSGPNGGAIRPGGDPDAKPVGLKARDFRFDPNSERFETITGTQQFGMSFDDWGNRFLCNQNHPCYHVVLPLRYLQRNPHFSPDETIFTTTPLPTPVHRISPIERWRHIKSSRRLATTPGAEAGAAGISHHVLDAGAGITIYRGGAYPPEYYGNIFIGDSVSNLVHRRVLVPHGATFRSERIDLGTEFARSSDPWFRPVNFINAPDGTLFCLDMAREYGESVNIPADVQAHLDLTSGRDRGRIYRLAPSGFKVPPPPRLSTATPAQLVSALESPHGWWRDTAHRLIFERQDHSVAPALVRMATESSSAQARVHALWCLRGLGLLEPATLEKALHNRHAGVRENAIRLAEAHLDHSDALRTAILRLKSDLEPRVRLQVAFAIGESTRWEQGPLLGGIALENLEDSWIQAAVLSSAANCSVPLFEAVYSDARFATDPMANAFLRQLLVSVGARHRDDEVNTIADRLRNDNMFGRSVVLFGGLMDGLKRGKGSAGSAAALARAPRFAPFFAQARKVAIAADEPEALRVSAIEALAVVQDEPTHKTLLSLLSAGEPEVVQAAALRGLRSTRNPAIAIELVRRFSALSPTLRPEALDLLIERKEYLEVLFTAMSRAEIKASDFSAAQLDLLRRHSDSNVRTKAIRLLGLAHRAARSEVYDQLRPALDLKGDAQRGKPVFESRCALCHQHAGQGQEVGPDLATVRSADRSNLLASIVDPNREVLPQYLTYVVETTGGDRLAGILVSDTSASVTLVQPGGLRRTIPRGDVMTLAPKDRSFMPEGLEAGLSFQQISDLLEYILHPEL